MAAIAAAISSNTAFKQNPLSVSSTTNRFLGGFSKKFNFDQKFGGKKRDLTGLVVASATESSIRSGGGRFYFNFTGFPFPLGPFLNRRTIRTEVSGIPMLLFLLFILILLELFLMHGSFLLCIHLDCINLVHGLICLLEV